MGASHVTWPDVVYALIIALPGLVAAVAALLNRRDLKTPSGMRLGYVAERAHDLSALAAARPDAKINGAVSSLPQSEPQPPPPSTG